ncbi:MAG: hypothetical protein ACFCVD_18430 [Nodosilinea sp.]
MALILDTLIYKKLRFRFTKTCLSGGLNEDLGDEPGIFLTLST